MKLNTDMLFYHKDINTFTVEASTLRLMPGEWPRSIELTSAKTGRVITVVAVHEQYSNDEDHELQCRIYKPLPREGVTFRLEIFND